MGSSPIASVGLNERASMFYDTDEDDPESRRLASKNQNDRFDPMSEPELAEIDDSEHLEWRRQYQNDAAIIDRLQKEGKLKELAEYINSLPD